MMLKRHPDWPERLARFLDTSRTKPFAWGENDCALFACDAVLEMTGADIAAAFRGQYSTPEGAALAMLRFLQRESATPDWKALLREVCQEIAGENAADEIPPRLARRGDIVLFNSENGLALGIVGLDGWRIVGAGPDGLARVPLRQGLTAWRVG